MALNESYRRSFMRQLQFISAKKPKYSWGGASDISSGLDCSGYIFLAAKWAGLPGIARTTSSRMALGLGGWSGHNSTLDKAAPCDLIFWTFTESRPNGHVGAVISSGPDIINFVHASQRRGVVSQNMTPPLRQKTTTVRKLSIGE